MRVTHYLHVNCYIKSTGTSAEMLMEYPGYGEPFACGQLQTENTNWTSNPELVTCKRCRKVAER
jgi:hypothetical protein